MKRMTGAGAGAVRPSRLRTTLRRGGEYDGKDAGAYTWMPEPGLSLAEVVDTVGALPEEAVLRLAAGLADDLAGLHRTGRVHGDVRPGTVLLTRTGPRFTDPGGGAPARPPERSGRQRGPSGDMAALGALLVTAYTGGRSGAGASASPKGPDDGVGELPERLREAVAVCLAEAPDARPTPARLLDTIGPLAPTPRPWPPAVNELITRGHPGGGPLGPLTQEPPAPPAEEPRGPAEATGLAAPSAEPPAVPRQASSSPGAARLRLAVLAAAVALASATVTALVVLVPGRDSGTRTIEAPPSHRPTAVETPGDVRGATPRQPVPDPQQDQNQGQDQHQGQDRDQERDRGRVTEPTGSAGRVPSSPTTQRTRQPGAIADCAGKPLSEPVSLLLACGDGGIMLHDLTWTGWGEPTATARGTVSEVVCEPTCVNGREVRSPATVTVSGLAGGRYTLLRLSAPRSPHTPLAHYSLDAMGPTFRG
ncbi:hypothetical protein ACF06Q_13215 [Streptomyces leeuwenhoekii]|uniref:hypothetical protein n=1 Tax=Streptomyces leeuwenhoekii TaxID=1437453 RepID=UPI0036FFBAB6